MLGLIAEKWWLFVVKGLLAILFGLLAFVRPEMTLLILVGIFGIYAFADGFLSLAGGLTLTRTRYFWWLLLEAVVGIAAGVLTFMFPGITVVSLLVLLGIWLVLAGIMRIVIAIELRKEIEGDWLYVLSGVITLGAGLLTFFQPLQTAVAWVWVVGMYAILFGLMSVGLGLRLHKTFTPAKPSPS